MKSYLLALIVCVSIFLPFSSDAAKPTRNFKLQTLSFADQPVSAGDSVDVSFGIINPRRGITADVWVQVELTEPGSDDVITASVAQSWAATPNTIVSDTQALTIPAGIEDGQYAIRAVVIADDETTVLAEFPGSQLLTVGVPSEPPTPPTYDSWELTVENGKILRDGKPWRSRGVNDYGVPRPYDLEDTSGSTSYLDKIASVTSPLSRMQQMKSDLPGMNTRRLPLSPLIADLENPNFDEQRLALVQYITNAKAVDDLVILSVYGSGQYGGADFPARLNDDEDTDAILATLIPVHQYFADLAAEHGNVAIDIMNEYRGNEPQKWSALFGGAIEALRDYGYDGLIIAGTYNWSTSADYGAATAVLGSDGLGKTCIGFHYYADSGSVGTINPLAKDFWPGMQALIANGHCVGVDEVGVSVGNNINKDGVAGSALGHMQEWREKFKNLPFVYAWQVLNDHNSLYGPLKVTKRRGGSVSGSWNEIYEGQAPFELNGLGALHRDYFIRPQPNDFWSQ